MPEWAADVELDEAHVRSLLDAQFPDLALDDVRPFAQGWDNALWQVDEDLLFRFPRRAVAGLPRDPMRRADAAVRVPRTRDRLAQLAAVGLWQPAGEAERILAAAALLGPIDPCAVVHGDLHVRHVLVDSAGRPSGVIDWGDCCLADPSVDMPLYWSLLDEAGRGAFRGAYGEAGLSSERLLRARVLALFLDASLALYAHDIADAALLRQTLANLERTLVD